jgi:myo-inositol 2-dehydrogenase / D-chiro-inositol 1-dehydrogenase
MNFVNRNRAEAVKIGLIGCGWVAENIHLPALQYGADAQVVAVAESDPDRLHEVAERFHIKHRYTNFLDLLTNPKVDAVAVCVPARFHIEVALAALDAGKHLFVEKPLALGIEDCEQLIERAAKFPGLKVMVGFNMRWHCLVRQAQEMILQGGLGPLEMIRSVLTSYHENIPPWRMRRHTGGGVFFEMAVHHFDLWRFLLRSEIREVFASSRSVKFEDDTATVTARMDNGLLATAVFSQQTTAGNEIDIYGQSGHLRVSCYRFDGLEFNSISTASGDFGSRMRRFFQSVKTLPQGLANMRRGGEFMASYRAEWRHFTDCIRQDRPTQCTLEDGRRALQAALAAAESASTGKSVQVSNVGASSGSQAPQR